DFSVEARNNRRFRENFAADADVLFPELVEELCSSRILVMQFIEGVKLQRFRETRADPKRLCAMGCRWMLKMVFGDGFGHADLHPGTILVTREGRLAILDLGLTGELAPAHKAGFARYFAAFAAGDGATMARLMAEMSPSRRIPDFP